MTKIENVGIVGVGKMGLRMALRLLEKGYKVVATDIDLEVVKKAEKQGVISVDCAEELAKQLLQPRIVILSIPSGEGIDCVINHLMLCLSKGDIVIDSGNSFYKDSQIRAERLKKKGIHFFDVGVSGGIDGARNGACLMIGGDKKAFKNVEYIFKDLSKDESYKYLGKSGAGHLVKGFHNFIEYGYLQALSEGVACLQVISEKEKMGLNLKDVCKVWNKGSIIESKLIKYLEIVLEKSRGLNTSGSVFGQSQKEMERLLSLIKEIGIEIPSCEAALNARISSQKKPTITGKITNAIRNVFGGHKEWEKQS